MTRIKDKNPSRRCVTCGELIEATGYNELWHKYTDHQVREHGKPGHREDA